MRVLKTVAAVCLMVAAVVSSANAAPVSLTLVRTSALYNEDPPGAPLPLGRTQYDAGDVMLNGQKIAEYLRVKDVHAGGMNTAALTLTLFFPRTGAPNSITLQGAHDFNSGEEMGSVSASSFTGLAGVKFTATGGGVLTLLLP
jgi:hypothetical protein